MFPEGAAYISLTSGISLQLPTNKFLYRTSTDKTRCTQNQNFCHNANLLKPGNKCLLFYIGVLIAAVMRISSTTEMSSQIWN